MTHPDDIIATHISKVVDKEKIRKWACANAFCLIFCTVMFFITETTLIVLLLLRELGSV